MGVTHTIGKISGQSLSLSLDVHVHNEDSNDKTPISYSAMVAEIDGAMDIPASIGGLPDDGDPSVRQISSTHWLVGISYRFPSLRPLLPPATGDERSGFAFYLPRKFVKWAPQVAAYPAGHNMGGFINVVSQFGDGHTAGTWIEPPPTNLTKVLTVHPSVVTGSWVRGIAAIVGGGYANSASLTGGTYAAGEVIITHILGDQTNANLFTIHIGWNWTQNVTGETRGDITGIAYDGQDYVWELEEDNPDRTNVIMAKKLKAVFVNRVRPRTDLAAIGVQPP